MGTHKDYDANKKYKFILDFHKESIMKFPLLLNNLLRGVSQFLFLKGITVLKMLRV